MFFVLYATQGNIVTTSALAESVDTEFATIELPDGFSQILSAKCYTRGQIINKGLGISIDYCPGTYFNEFVGPERDEYRISGSVIRNNSVYHYIASKNTLLVSPGLIFFTYKLKEKDNYQDIVDLISTFKIKGKVMGNLGKPIATELTIEGVSSRGKGDFLSVTKVDGKEIAPPIGVEIYNLYPDPVVPANTVCRFEGIETIIDFGNSSMTQKFGKQLWFKVNKVLSPAYIRLRPE